MISFTKQKTHIKRTNLRIPRRKEGVRGTGDVRLVMEKHRW